jgi:hypothetical protein
MKLLGKGAIGLCRAGKGCIPLDGCLQRQGGEHDDDDRHRDGRQGAQAQPDEGTLGAAGLKRAG